MLIIGFILLLIGIRILIVVHKSKIINRQLPIYKKEGMIRANGRIGVDSEHSLNENYYRKLL